MVSEAKDRDRNGEGYLRRCSTFKVERAKEISKIKKFCAFRTMKSIKMDNFPSFIGHSFLNWSCESKILFQKVSEKQEMPQILVFTSWNSWIEEYSERAGFKKAPCSFSQLILAQIFEELFSLGLFLLKTLISYFITLLIPRRLKLFQLLLLQGPNQFAASSKINRLKLDRISVIVFKMSRGEPRVLIARNNLNNKVKEEFKNINLKLAT